MAVAARDKLTGARSRDEVSALREAWTELRPTDVNADPDVFLANLERRPEVIRPNVLLAEDDGVPRGLLAARLEHVRIPVRLGYCAIYRPRLRALTVVQGGIVGAHGAATARLFQEATNVLAGGEADVLRLRSVRLDSDLHRLAHEQQPRTLRGRQEPRAWLRWRLGLPGSLDEILALQSRRTRSKHRALARRLEDEFGPRLSLDVYRDRQGFDRLVRDAATVSAKTYQRSIGGGFAADPAELGLLELAADRGWLRAYVLDIDDEPRAFWVGVVYGGVFYAGPTGYDPALAGLRLGRYALLRMLADLCEDDEVDEVDWGVGEDAYKRQFGSECWFEEDLLVFARTVRGVRTNLTRSVLQNAVVGARRLGEHGVRRRWRSRLAAGGGDR